MARRSQTERLSLQLSEIAATAGGETGKEDGVGRREKETGETEERREEDGRGRLKGDGIGRRKKKPGKRREGRREGKTEGRREGRREGDSGFARAAAGRRAEIPISCRLIDHDC